MVAEAVSIGSLVHVFYFHPQLLCQEQMNGNDKGSNLKLLKGKSKTTFARTIWR